MDRLYVDTLDYQRNHDTTIAYARFSNDPSFMGVEVHYVIALELIQAIADAGGVDIEILGPRK